MTHYVGVTIGNRPVSEANSYLSGTDKIVEEVEGFSGKILVVEVESQKKAGWLSDRFNSGLLGSRDFTSKEAVNAWVEEWL